MMRSLFSGVSGLRVHQTRMDVIANNIANVNTAGYKTSRTTFHDMFNQTLSGATRPDRDTGVRGRNPMQIGLGVNVSSIDMLMTTGAAQRTDWALDLMIQGEGFFILEDAQGANFFSRAGAFRVDEAGNLVNPGGFAVTGWNRSRDTDPASPTFGQWIIQRAANTNPIVITPDMEFAAPSPTSAIDVTGNLNQMLDTYWDSTKSFYDSLGNRWLLDVRYTFVPHNPGVDDAHWIMTVREQGGNNATLASDPSIRAYIPVGFAPVYHGPSGLWNSSAPLIPAPPPFTPPTLPAGLATFLRIEFDQFGAISNVDADAAAAFSPGVPYVRSTTEIKIVAASPPPPGSAGDFGAIIPDVLGPPGARVTNDQIITNFSSLRQVNQPSNAHAIHRNGNEAGRLIGFSVGGDGTLTGIYSNGNMETLAQLAIAQFRNAAGLEKVGSSLFSVTGNSGDPNIIVPGTGGTQLLSGVLEMSNVDLSLEFSDMIITQRGFQSNARVISVSDEMLQELANLRR